MTALTVPTSTVNAAASVGLDWNSIGATQQFQSDLDAAASPDVQAQVKADTQSAAQAAVSGKPLTDDQIRGAFVAAATGAAVIAGVSATVAAGVFAPIAVVVFGGGYLAGEAIKTIFHITNHSPIACSPDDHTQYGTDPSDPKWKSYEKDYVPVLLKPYGGGTWQPYSSGSFENWARPALLHLYDLQANCKAPPNVATDLGTYQFLLGMVNAWNAQFPTAPMRTITSIYDDKDPSTFTAADWDRVVDPIQWALLKFAISQGKTKPGVTLQVADPPAPSKTTVAGAGASLALGGLAGGLLFAWVSGTAANVVFDSAWAHLVGLFRSSPPRIPGLRETRRMTRQRRR